jgi:hypothetical protein
MPVQVWPSTLPQMMNGDGYSRTLPDTRQRTPMDSGNVKVSRKSVLAISKMAGSFYMSRDQLLTFTNFFQVTTGGGTLLFTFPDQEGGATPLLARFGEKAPVINSIDIDAWNVSIELDIIP